MIDLLKKILKSLFLSLHLIIFAGIGIQGYFSLTRGFFISDKFFGVAYILIGIIFSVLIIKSIWSTFKSEKIILYPWKKNGVPLSVTAVIIAILLVGKKFITIQLFYAGLIVGEFAITQARHGYIRITDIDLYDFQFDKLAWLAHIYLVYSVVHWIYSIIISKRLDSKI